jgi:protein O-GlcNAc transferase
LRKRLVRAFDRFHDVRETGDRDAARLISEIGTDILVDLNGYTIGCRPEILALRPAPVQASYLGFPATLGADFVDYIIADPVIVPFDQAAFYTEKIVHLPDTYQPNATRREIAARPSRREAGLPDDGFVFCCFNNHLKITAAVFDTWMRLLTAVEGSVLWLSEFNGAAALNLMRAAAARGVDPARLVFAPRTPDLADHLARLQLAGLFLDTLPYNAHTTASDALWAGVPVVTCRGETFAARVAASVLGAVGLPDLITTNLADYEALALWLATDPPLLESVRQRLEANRLTFPLFDLERFRRHIEAAFVTMWDIARRGEPPRNFAVDPATP